MKKIICSIVATGMCIMAFSASAVSSEDIQKEIDNAQYMCETAHEMAESARELGAEESHYCIWFAQEQWKYYNNQLIELQKQYDEIIEQEKQKQQEQEQKNNYLGNFKISFYCPCSTCNGSSHGITASGTNLTVGRTVAVDSNIIPLGTEIYIDGIGWRVAEDTGGAIKGNKIDVLVSSHSEAYAKGIVYANVYK